MTSKLKEYSITGFAALIVPVDYVLAAESEEEAVKLVQRATMNMYCIDNLDDVHTDQIDCEFVRDLK